VAGSWIYRRFLTAYGPFVYRLGRQVFNLERAVQLR